MTKNKQYVCKTMPKLFCDLSKIVEYKENEEIRKTLLIF